MKKYLITTAAIFGAFALNMTANAASFGAQPVDYVDAAADYIEGRMIDADGVRVAALTEPYRVLVDLNGGESEACWAVDMRVRMDLGTGRSGRDTMTVIFYQDQAVALQSDLRTRLTVYDASAAKFASK